MADLDAELLALAGGDESSGDEATSPPRDKSPSPEISSRRRSSTPQAMGQRGTARPVKKTVRRRPARKRDSDEDEISDASSRRNSVDSAPMDESQSEGGSPPPPADDGPIFPYDKYYHSAQDKTEIMAMPEIQREEIIAERAQQVERHQQDMALRRLLASRERDEARAAEKKRKASAADLEETHRKSSRQRTTIGGRRAGEASSAIEAYKRHREEKGLRDAQRRQEAAARAKAKAERGDSPQDDYDENDADGDSEVEWDDPKTRRRSPTPQKDDPPAELLDIQRARIGRDNFAQVCFYPGFDEAIKNCYTRICIGPGPNGQNAYRLAKIIGFTKQRPYAIQGPNGRMFVTDQWVLAAHGKAERAWPFLECSNSPFTEDEWRRYRVVVANENIKLPTKGQVNKKLDEINKLINHHFTEAQISEKMRRQNGLLDMVNRVSERKEIEERRRLARAADDEDAIRQCEDELKALVPMKLACNTTLYPTRTEIATASPNKKKEADRLAEINRRNQQINAENVRKAQLAESRVKRSRALPTQSATSNDGLLKPPSAVTAAALDDELFGSDRSRAGTPLTGATNTPKLKPTTPRSGTPDIASVPVIKTATGANGELKKKPSSSFGLLRKKQKDEDALAALDLGIEIEI